MSKVVLYMSADVGHPRRQTTARGRPVHQRTRGVTPVGADGRGQALRRTLADAAQAMDEVFSEPSKRHATPESS